MTPNPREALLDRRFAAIIDGQATASVSGEVFATIDPATGNPLAEVPRCRAVDVAAAVESAERTFRAPGWSRLKPFERGRMLHRLSALLLSSLDELTGLESLDTGKPLSQARSDVVGAARYFEFYAGLADKIEGTQTPLGYGYFAIGSREPYGVVGVIVPWNLPINQAARSLGPALACGNTVVLKPAENTPLSAIRLGELALEAGFPPGAVNVVTGYGTEAGEPLVQHELVRKVSFTGSVATGQRVASIAAERVIPSSLELGGKSACIIFPDADIDAVVRSMVTTVTLNAGQVCSAATRVVAQTEILEPLLEAAAHAMEGITVGQGIDDPMLGPLVSAEQRQRVLGYVELGLEQGATARIGGGPFDQQGLTDGYFVRPTVLTGVHPEMRVAQEEIFGPVITTHEVSDEDEAIEVANGTDYGLAAGVYTRDFDRAMRVSHAMEAGQVFVNEYLAGGVETAFGGYKRSGWGREKGTAAIHDYTQLKTTIFRFG